MQAITEQRLQELKRRLERDEIVDGTAGVATSGKICWTEGEFLGLPGKLLTKTPNGDDIEITNMDIQSIDLDTGEAVCLSRIGGSPMLDADDKPMTQTLYFPGPLRFEW